LKLGPFIPVLIIAVGVWAYHDSFQGPFIFDDVPSILDNPHIRHLWPLREAMSAPLDRTVTGRPVVCLTLALNYALGGLNVWGYHAFNLTVHLLAALVLFGILRRTFEGAKLRDRFGTAAVWLAAAIALIWEVHPLQTESVTYIVQRTESLMGLFLLLTLYCTLRGSRSSRARVWYLAAVVSCALGTGSKEVMVGAPLIVLLYDRVFLAASFRQLWQRRIGLYVGLAATWVILGVLVARTIHHHSMTGFGFQSLTPWAYLRTEAGVIVYYLRLCFWPRPLVIDYFDWPIASSLKDGLASGVVVVGLLGATVWAFRRQAWLGFLGAWFFLILGPTSSILPSAGEVAAERRMYLPLAAVVTMAVVGAFALGKGLWNKQQGVVLGCVAGGSVVVLFTFLTIQRNQDYKSALTIWRDTVEKRPNNPRAHNNLGNALLRTGTIGEAIAHYEQALRLKPDYAEAHNALGFALAQTGRIEDAIAHFEQALRIKPDDANAHSNLGTALGQTGRMPEAMEHLEQALRLKPGSADAHYNLGVALEQAGRVQEAIGHYKQAVRIKPDFTQAQNALARLQAGQ
jgi:Flp pilus assembly protein TadD